MQGNYKIAGHIFRLDTLYEYVHQLCEGYQTAEPAEFSIVTTLEDVEAEKAGTARECAEGGNPPIALTPDACESIAVYRKIVEALFPFDFLLFHGSVVAVGGRAYMFTARSGTGKSTHTRMWRALLGDRATMVNDDKPLVHVAEGRATAYGTPWNGKHRLGSNIAVPLKGICILNRGGRNAIREISLADAYPMLLQQVHRVPGRSNMQRGMALIDEMAASVKFYTMTCDISTGAAKMAYRAMSGKELQQ